MHDQVIVWNDKMPVDGEQEMADGHERSSRDVQANASKAVGVAGAGSSGEVSVNEALAVYMEAAPISGSGVSGERDAMSRFGSLGCALLPSAHARGGECGDTLEAGSVAATDGCL